MKKRKKTKRSPRKDKLTLKLSCYGDYISEAGQLETMLAGKPRRLTIEMVGFGEVPPDSALLMRSIILARTAATRIVTNARSSLQGGAVLLWLLGDIRHIREDARLYLKPAGPFAPDARPGTGWRDRNPYGEEDLEEDDYIRVLQAINEFLPVKDLAGHPIELPVLKQFGLVENETMDRFLANVFQKEKPPAERPKTRPKKAARNMRK